MLRSIAKFSLSLGTAVCTNLIITRRELKIISNIVNIQLSNERRNDTNGNQDKG